MSRAESDTHVSNGPNLSAMHRATYVRLLDLPRHKWEPSKASDFPLSYEPRHKGEA